MLEQLFIEAVRKIVIEELTKHNLEVAVLTAEINALKQRFDDFTTNVNTALENKSSTQTRTDEELTEFIVSAVRNECDIEDFIDERVERVLEDGEYIKSDALEDAISEKVEVKMNLGLMDQEFAQMGEYANEMSRFVLNITDAHRWFAELVSNRMDMTDEEIFDMANKSRVFKSMWDSYVRGPGAEPTIWGAFNAVTHNVDWVKGRSMDTRFDSAQFGQGANLKAAAWAKAKAIIDGIKAANDAIAIAAA